MASSHSGAAAANSAAASSSSAKPGWYQSDVQDIDAEERELLEKYAGVPSADVVPHVIALRDKAFKVWQYACIGQMRFLTFNTLRLPFYPELVQRLKAGATFCDAGCCFGQEIRHLVYAQQLDSANFYGFDLEMQFLDVGYELFRDRDTLKASFRAGSILEPPLPGGLGDFKDKMDIVFCSSFLHVFGWDQMIEAAVNLVSLARPQSGSIICGKQLGNVNCGEAAMPTKGGSIYRHNVESMARFWNEVGDKTGSVWSLEGGLYDGFELAQNKNQSWSDPTQKMLWWKATRN